MAVPAPAVPFLLRLADGRTWGAVQFPGGFICVYHPDEINVCTIAISLDALVGDSRPGNVFQGAQAEDFG
jgi:hypothetical protein